MAESASAPAARDSTARAGVYGASDPLPLGDWRDQLPDCRAPSAAIAPVLFPEMERRGAKKGDLVALLSATGAQTETIPPSLVLLTIGSVTGVSIAALFTGGMLPAVVLGLALCALVWWRYRNEDLSHVKRASWGQVGWTFLVALPAVALRFFNVYGERQSLSNPYTGVAAIFSSRLLNDRPPLVFEDGRQTRDFIDVRDIVLLAVGATRADQRRGDVVTVGGQRVGQLTQRARAEVADREQLVAL